MDEKQYFSKLNEYINKILRSKAPKKLIVAGPGTGKTDFFGKAIKHYGGSKNDYLVLTFINNLEDELRKDLGDISKVYTFHGYCHYLLRKYSNLRVGLEDDFEYYPPLIKLIKTDWEISKQKEAPRFSILMRNTNADGSLDFYLERGNYYNAVGYDDSVYRVFKSLSEGKSFRDKYKLIIVDEYQDFNKLETSVLSFISDHSPTLIVGDDDQALYCQLRDSNPDFIRSLFHADDYEFFELPFCLRCPESVIKNFDMLVNKASKNGLLGKRLKKRFDFFPPIKGVDSKTYPKVKLVISSIQRKTPLAANYLGRYIVQEIKKITKEEIKESHEKDFPTVLIIGPSYYLESVLPILESVKLDFDFKKKSPGLEIEIQKGLLLLKSDDKHRLGWRMVIEIDKPKDFTDLINRSILKGEELYDLIPEKYKRNVLEKVSEFEPKLETEEDRPDIDRNKPKIQLVTYEGAKGLSAQHVFILGLQDGNLPRNVNDIKDIELCKFLVALARTRKQCHILCTTNFAGKGVKPSVFVDWLAKDHVHVIKINKNYWKN